MPIISLLSLFINYLTVMKAFFSPAKLNLLLSVHGQRVDGFHELTSLVVGLNFGDTLEIALNNKNSDSLECTGDSYVVPLDESNLIIKMADLLRNQLKLTQYFDFKLNKQIPVGSGLGGGSSNAVTALNGMLELMQLSMEEGQKRSLVSTLGSDCSFFVNPVPSIMEGRGEIIRSLNKEEASFFSGKKALLFKPSFSINTSDAYAHLTSSDFEEKSFALSRMHSFFQEEDYSQLLFNSFWNHTERKYLALSLLIKNLREEGVFCNMSGSGSACFALLSSKNQSKEERYIKEAVQAALGSDAFIETVSFV